MEISSGNRYIVAGFCEYGVTNPIQTFEALYNPTYDGYAYQAGFRNGDIIFGLQVCERFKTQSNEVGSDGGFANDDSTEEFEVRKRLIRIEPDISSEDWVQAAQSCEILAPGESTVMVVKRQIGRGS
jgi:hypothetical protein